MLLRSNPHNSEFRIPHPYNNSKITLSRSGQTSLRSEEPPRTGAPDLSLLEIGVSTAFFEHNEFITRFNSSTPGTRGKCFGNLGVLTNTAGFASTTPALAIHLNQLRTAASARAALAFVNSFSYNTPR